MRSCSKTAEAASQSTVASPSDAAATADSCCIDTDNDHAQASNRLQFSEEELAARQSDNYMTTGNIYHSIDNATYENLSASSPSQIMSPPEPAAATPAASYDVDLTATNDSSRAVDSFYEAIDEDRTTPQTSSTSIPPSPATSIYEWMGQPRLESSPASPQSSAPRPAPRSQPPPEATDVYIGPSSFDDDVPCVYQLEPNAIPTIDDNADFYQLKPNNIPINGDYANCYQLKPNTIPTNGDYANCLL